MEGKNSSLTSGGSYWTRELKIVWKLIQENYEFSSAERCSLNTHTILWTFYGEKIQAFFPLLHGFRISVEYIKCIRHKAGSNTDPWRTPHV